MIQQVTGNVFINYSTVLLARVVDSRGELVAPASVLSASYTVFQLDPTGRSVVAVVSGHSGVSIAPAELLFSALQNTGEWTLAGGDSTGYNLRFQIPTSAGQPFPAPALYRIEIALTPADGSPVWPVRFQVNAT